MSHTYRMSHVLTYILTSGRAEEFKETEGNKILEAFAGVYMSHLDFFFNIHITFVLLYLVSILFRPLEAKMQILFCVGLFQYKAAE